MGSAGSFGASVRAAAAALAFSALLFTPAAGRAQTKATDDGVAGNAQLRPLDAFTPLRASIMGGIFPPTGVYVDCEARDEASGNTQNGFALARYGFQRLLPRLTLHGFSSAGCPTDSGGGGALTYSMPLGRRLWLVPSAGMYVQPGVGPLSAAILTTAARVDVVKQLGWGRTLSFGIGTRQRIGGAQFPAFSFGGSF